MKGKKFVVLLMIVCIISLCLPPYWMIGWTKTAEADAPTPPTQTCSEVCSQSYGGYMPYSPYGYGGTGTGSYSIPMSIGVCASDPNTVSRPSMICTDSASTGTGYPKMCYCVKAGDSAGGYLGYFSSDPMCAATCMAYGGNYMGICSVMPIVPSSMTGDYLCTKPEKCYCVRWTYEMAPQIPATPSAPGGSGTPGLGETAPGTCPYPLYPKDKARIDPPPVASGNISCSSISDIVMESNITPAVAEAGQQIAINGYVVKYSSNYSGIRYTCRLYDSVGCKSGFLSKSCRACTANYTRLMCVGDGFSLGALGLLLTLAYTFCPPCGIAGLSMIALDPSTSKCALMGLPLLSSAGSSGGTTSGGGGTTPLTTGGSGSGTEKCCETTQSGQKHWLDTTQAECNLAKGTYHDKTCAALGHGTGSGGSTGGTTPPGSSGTVTGACEYYYGYITNSPIAKCIDLTSEECAGHGTFHKSKTCAQLGYPATAAVTGLAATKPVAKSSPELTPGAMIGIASCVMAALEANECYGVCKHDYYSNACGRTSQCDQGGCVVGSQPCEYPSSAVNCGGYSNKDVKIDLKTVNGTAVGSVTVKTDYMGIFSFVFLAPYQEGQYMAVVNTAR